MIEPKLQQSIAGLLRFYCEMTPESLPRLRALARPDMYFRDPFNELEGFEAVNAMFVRMFADLDELVWDIKGQAVDGRTLYLVWRFRARLRGRGLRLDFPGMSEIRFDEDGLMASHIDYWDAAQYFYEKLPLLGTLLRWLRGRIGQSTVARR